MALSQKRKQQKLSKKNQKRKQQVKIQKQLIPSIYNSKIEACYVTQGLWETGMGVITLTRRTTIGQLYTGIYLLDIWMLGIKDSFMREMSQEMLNLHLSKQSHTMVTPDYCKALIMSCIQYGKQNGFSPNMNDKSWRFVAGIDYDPAAFKFEFGREGRPCYVEGPYDDPVSTLEILGKT